ncbi:DDE-type integrase/transposase/recombinase [uncultured Senegalimassilia sp.]|uniref:DDE-type integrase/transposase/recombinase n=1 Tax=uncultured Senegalimassilia sp. TaxID=1714350 RepID=UPI0026768F3D|nr:DDE-type integrase/transposase/recombinase [uncultured Senegalimassilia sp.]
MGTGEGWPCLAAAIDAFHRKAVGWSMSGRMTEKPVADALEQAVGRESPPEGFSLVFHDGQGSQNASRAFQRCFESHGIAQSMSRPGNPWDNAPAESLFKTLKRELVNGKGCKTREEAKQDAFECIELYCNRRRMHSSVGHNAPCDLERDVA